MYTNYSCNRMWVCLLLLSTVGPVLSAVNGSAPNSTASDPSVYESFENLFKAVHQAQHSLSTNYGRLVANRTDAMANWFAYSELLKPVNQALMDSVFPLLMDQTSDANLSPDCVVAMFDFAAAVDQQQSWAYRMMDSSGNIFPSGFMSGSFSHLGDFDQCLETGQPVRHNPVHGQYCLIKYNMQVPTNKSRILSQDVVFNTTGTSLQGTFFADFLKYGHVFKVRSGRIGVCLPSSCSLSDVETIVNNFVKMDKFNVEVDSCQTADDYGKYSTLQVCIMTAIGSLFVLVVVATVYELLTIYRPKQYIEYELTKWMLNFSAYSNTATLMSTKLKKDNLRSINGIRVLTMCWLVYAHAYFLSIKEAFRSSRMFIESIYDVKMYFILNAWPAVEVFFIISALLQSYHIFQSLARTHKLNVLKLVCNRVFRLWPNLWLTVGLVFVVPALAQGPLWPDVMRQQVDSCYSTWWKVPLFVSNFRAGDETCQVHTWYLSVDTQLYVGSFIFVYLLYKYQKKAIYWALVVALIVGSITSCYFYLNHSVPTILFNNVEERQIYADMAAIYMPTQFHITPYLVGIVTGYMIMLGKHDRIRMSRGLNLIMWVICITITVSVILSGYWFTAYQTTSPINQSMYAGFHRLLWSMAVSYLMYACENKQGGVFSEILSHPMFVPLSRLSYLVYLLHFVITWARTGYIRAPLVYSNYTLMNEFIVNLVLSLILAFIFYLVVEAPFNNLYSKYIGTRIWSCCDWYLKDDDDEANAKQGDDKELQSKVAYKAKLAQVV